MPKYRQYFRQMIAEHEQVFADFKITHDNYQTNQKVWQDEYNQQGIAVVEIIRAWETKLCGNMERGENAVFSGKLAEKFWGEVRAFFPLIDMVGVKIS